jgi:hypothetical protein
MAEKFRLIVEVDGCGPVQVTDPGTLSSCAKWLRTMADAANAASAETLPSRRGPGRPPKATTADGNGNETPPIASV